MQHNGNGVHTLSERVDSLHHNLSKRKEIRNFMRFVILGNVLFNLGLCQNIFRIGLNTEYLETLMFLKEDVFTCRSQPDSFMLTESCT